MNQPQLATALAKLDAWLDTMRGPRGYGGPISHWWESNLLFTGPLYDWRYEGIIDGYREIYLHTKERRYLDKALRAADDIVAHLLPDGRIRNSSFQFGPVPGGTPHEAAIDVTLLKLVRTLRAEGIDDGQRYLDVARANLMQYWIGRLWNGQGFQDQPYNPVLVANKHGTLLEALLEYRDITSADVDEYIEACIKVILRAQIDDGPQKGGTVHLGIGPSRLAIPIYTARAINGIVTYYAQSKDDSLNEPIVQAVGFVKRLLTGRGVEWGIYGSGRPCPNPVMIAGAGDILRLFIRAQKENIVECSQEIEGLANNLIACLQPSGGLPTAHGFQIKGLSGEPKSLGVRDVLPVVGWIDKAFRALALLLRSKMPLPNVSLDDSHLVVTWKRLPFSYTETTDHISLVRGKELFYKWRKGSFAPDVYRL